MNSSGYNYGGWKDSEMRTYLNSTASGNFYAGLPTDLKSVIKSVNKVSDDGYDESTGVAPDTLVTTSDKLWLLSTEEAGLYRDYSNVRDYTLSGQGSAYALYKNDASRVVSDYEYDGSYDDYGEYYWLRSACSNYRSYFWCVAYAGSNNYVGAANAHRVAPGFCI